MFDWYLNWAQFHGLSNGLNWEWIKNHSNSSINRNSTVKPIYKRNDIAMHKWKKDQLEITMMQEWKEKEKQCHFIALTKIPFSYAHDAYIYNNNHWNEFNSVDSKKDWRKTNFTTWKNYMASVLSSSFSFTLLALFLTVKKLEKLNVDRVGNDKWWLVICRFNS